MDNKVEDTFYDEFFDDENKCFFLQPNISTPSSSGEIKIPNNQNDCNEINDVKMDCDVIDDFYDEYFDNINNYNPPSQVKDGISLCSKKVPSFVGRVERNFVPFTESHKEFQDLLKDVHIHPKKVEEIVNIFNNFINHRNNKIPKILLLTGPSGCGKRFLLNKIFKLFEFKVKRYDETQMQSYRKSDLIHRQSYLDSFIKFLSSCKYSSGNLYTSYGIKKLNLVFIDELPNFIFEDPNIFSTKLADIIKTNYVPIYVFLFTTSSSLIDHSYYRIFTSDVLEQLQVKHIQMMSVAKSFLFDALKNYVMEKSVVIPSYGKVLKLKGKSGYNEFWERVINLADGDIRQGKIIIDFCTTVDSDSPGLKRRKSGIFQSQNTIESRQCRFDVSFLNILENGKIFKIGSLHALGKLFYAKRSDEKINPKILRDHNKVENMLPKELQNLKRPLPLKESISDFVTFRPFTTSQLLEYLFEHEHYFANDIRSLVKIYHNVLTIDSALQTDNLRYTDLDEYCYEIACRSLLYYNYKDDKNKYDNNKFYQITKPKSGYKSLNDVGNKIKKLHNYAFVKFNNVVCYKDLPDYLDCQEFTEKLKI